MKSKALHPRKTIQRHLLCILSICVYGGLFCASVWGLNRERTITQFHHTAWTSKDKAPSMIEALAQTNDGYLWLGTASGLYRFDGVVFERYEPRSGGPMPSDNIFSLFASSDGGLWIGFQYGGASFLKDGNIINYGEREGFPTGRVQGFASDEEGRIWAATLGGLARLEGSNWQRIGMEWNYPGKAAQEVFVDNGGTLWVATEDTIVFRTKGVNSFQTTGEQIKQVLEITQDRDGALWIAETSRSVRQVLLPGTDPKSLGPEIGVGSVAVLFDREGALWATSIGDGIRRVPFTERFRGQMIAQFSTDAEIFTEKDGLSGDSAMPILEDREGNIWIGTANGLDRFRESSLVPVSFPPGYDNFGLFAGDKGDVWTFSTNRPLRQIRGETPAAEFQISPAYSVYLDEDGTVWLGSDDGVYRFRDGKHSFVNSPLPHKNTDSITLFKDRNGLLWSYFNREGIFWLKDDVWIRYDRQSELPKESPIVGFIDSLDRKWFGYAENILTLIDGDLIRTFSGDDGLRAGDIKAIYERSGRIWVAGSLGVGVFEENRFRMLAAETAEALSGVSGIVETQDGSLWLNASRGVIHIPAEDVRLFLENPAHKVRYRVFDFLDGLPGMMQQNRPFPTAIEGSNGRLWFSTNKGVVWIDPQQIPGNNLPPPVSISSVVADEKLYEPLPSLELPEGTTSLQINFTALSFSIPERVRFRYWLEGVDNGWKDSTSIKRFADYTNLGPGNYRFHVVASNNDGVWNEEGATVEFSIAPMFYQTLWFRALIFLFALLLVVGAFVLFYRWRLARATERLNLGFEERLAERTRIAHELHDTLLQGFFGASMRLQAVSNLLPAKSEKAKENLDDVLDQIDVVLEDGRRAIWDMNSSDATEKDLGQAFTLVGENLNKSYPANFSITIEGQNRPLYPLVRDQIYRIGREALINAFRHSQATNIELEIEYAPKHLRLVVRDDGCGIQPDVLSAGREGHLGLSGMRKYAEKIGAELKIWSRAGSGTDVELFVPQQIAFIKESSGGLFSRLSRLYSRKAAPRRLNGREK